MANTIWLFNKEATWGLHLARVYERSSSDVHKQEAVHFVLKQLANSFQTH